MCTFFQQVLSNKLLDQGHETGIRTTKILFWGISKWVGVIGILTEWSVEKFLPTWNYFSEISSYSYVPLCCSLKAGKWYIETLGRALNSSESVLSPDLSLNLNEQPLQRFLSFGWSHQWCHLQDSIHWRFSSRRQPCGEKCLSCISSKQSSQFVEGGETLTHRERVFKQSCDNVEQWCLPILENQPKSNKRIILAH